MIPLAALLAIGLAACGGEPVQSSPTAASTTATVDPAAPPESVTWTPYRTIALPTSTRSGPRSVTQAATGFEHSGQGAALAAIHTSIRMSVAPDDQWAEVVRQSVAAGPGRDAFMIARAQLSIDPAQTQAANAPTVRGYVLDSYSPEKAELHVITSYSDNSVLSTKATVIWRDGDWKLVLPDPASPDAASQALASLPDPMTHLEAPR